MGDDRGGRGGGGKRAPRRRAAAWVGRGPAFTSIKSLVYRLVGALPAAPVCVCCACVCGLAFTPVKGVVRCLVHCLVRCLVRCLVYNASCGGPRWGALPSVKPMMYCLLHCFVYCFVHCCLVYYFVHCLVHCLVHALPCALPCIGPRGQRLASPPRAALLARPRRDGRALVVLRIKPTREGGGEGGGGAARKAMARRSEGLCVRCSPARDFQLLLVSVSFQGPARQAEARRKGFACAALCTALCAALCTTHKTNERGRGGGVRGEAA